ncbi:DNA topoisomerase-1 [Spirosoma oryzae]|uniref:DNA topoisomerase 1 n=1 Tax=Spirosoma oryzae TaxID=1469603 RepID=A0A2T0S300_9BACT|nr:type I DNA topoisomerase [Spirosoma oryzae]PRY27798.1 DNA topoisomerase-1 [Spirosoma oryzae]
MNLLIVESPNKCAKIQSILDSAYGSGNWIVAASVGHIRDLPKNQLGVDRADNYKRTYVISDDKQSVVSKLRAQVAKTVADRVYMATDPDREGEAIAWHLAIALKLDPRTARRVTFNEITAKAVTEAISSYRTIDTRLTAAQETRRVIDRLVGYEVSDLMSRKLGDRLSAGRVQSVALRLCVERERQIEGFADQFTFKLKADFLTPRKELLVAQYHQAMSNQNQVTAYMQTVPGKQFRVTDVSQKPVSRSPQPAFTTSTLQQEAIRKLSRGNQRWSAKQVMDVAQKLFEQGAITYMRTDSPNLSAEAVESIRQLVSSRYGADYFQANTYKAKEAAQEAHEAIRPTHFEQPTAGETDEQQQLYASIYSRAVASQMKPALYQQTIISIGSQQPGDTYTAKASVLVFEGYRKVYQEESDEEGQEENTPIKAITSGEVLSLQQLVARQTYAQPPKRFDEASLVAELEKRGIGRPSTYASILSKIVSQHYVDSTTVAARKLTAQLLTYQHGQIRFSTEQQSIGGDKNRLQPSPTGRQITEFLEVNFTRMVDFQFTALMEQTLDDIVVGKGSYLSTVGSFDAQHQHQLQTAEQRTADKPRANRQRLIGDHEGSPLKVGLGKNGVYVLWNDAFYSVEGQTDPATVTMPMAIAAIQAKAERQQQQARDTLRVIQGNRITYTIRKGQYGIYLTDGSVNVTLKEIKTDEQMAALTATNCKQIIDDYKASKSSAGSQGRVTKKSPARSSKTKR